MTAAPTWNRVVYLLDIQRPDPEALRGLIEGRHAVVVLKGLLPSDVFKANRERIDQMFGSSSTAQYVNGTLTTIGPFLARHLSDPDAYFAAARDAQRLCDEVGFDLDERVRGRLQEVFGLAGFAPAREPDGREYASSIIRIHADGVRNPLHNDNIMRDGAGTGLAVADLRCQLSCVVCVQECDEGGELKIYQKSWVPADEKFKIENGLGYDSGVVSGVPCHVFKPETEDVYLINPTYYHEIETVGGGPRLTMGSFFGFIDDKLTHSLAWS